MHDDPTAPLPRGLYRHRRQYRTRVRDEWLYFGSDYVAAVSAYAAWKHSGGGKPGTIAWLLDNFVGVACPGRVKAKTMAPRTARDYLRDAEILKKGLGHIPARRLEAKHVATFRDERAQDAPSHVRNEMACLSAALIVGTGEQELSSVECGDGRAPPPQDGPRTADHDDEYLTIYDRAQPSVQLAMVLGCGRWGCRPTSSSWAHATSSRTASRTRCAFVAARPRCQSNWKSSVSSPIALAPFLNRAIAASDLRATRRRQAVHRRRHRRDVPALLRWHQAAAGGSAVSRILGCAICAPRVRRRCTGLAWTFASSKRCSDTRACRRRRST